MSQQEEEETVWCQNQIIILKIFLLFTELLLARKIKKTQILINKPVYLGLSILELSKILIYEFCHYYVEPKYCENAKLCYMDTDTFIVYLKKDDI